MLVLADWWGQQAATHSKYANLSIVARDKFYSIPTNDLVEVSCALGWNDIFWMQLKTKGKTLPKNVVVREFAQANNVTLQGDDPALDMKRAVKGRKVHRMVLVCDSVEMWQGSHHLCATNKKSRT